MPILFQGTTKVQSHPDIKLNKSLLHFFVSLHFEARISVEIGKMAHLELPHNFHRK